MENKNVYEAPKSDLRETVKIEEEYELASRWERFGGAMIDGIIASLITFPLMYFTGTWDKLLRGEYPLFEMALFLAFGILLYLALHGYLLAKYGQTIGKKMMGIKIVSIESMSILPLQKIFLLRFLPSALASSIPTIGQFFGFIDIVFIFGKKKRCVHDLIAGTIVVKDNAH